MPLIFRKPCTWIEQTSETKTLAAISQFPAGRKATEASVMISNRMMICLQWSRRPFWKQRHVTSAIRTPADESQNRDEIILCFLKLSTGQIHRQKNQIAGLRIGKDTPFELSRYMRLKNHQLPPAKHPNKKFRTFVFLFIVHGILSPNIHCMISFFREEYSTDGQWCKEYSSFDKIGRVTRHKMKKVLLVKNILTKKQRKEIIFIMVGKL